MKKKEAQWQVRRLAREGKVVMADSSRIDRHPYERQREFLASFGFRSARFMLTDDSTVGDLFSTRIALDDALAILRRRFIGANARSKIVEFLDRLYPQS